MRRQKMSWARLLAIGVVAVGASVGGSCSNCSPAEDSGDEVAKNEGQPTASSAQNTGKLVVKAGSDFQFRVFGGDPEKEVTSGTCNIHQPELPAGTYRVVVSVPNGPPVTLGPVALAIGQSQTVTLGGFGQLKVGAVKDFLKYRVKDGAGKAVATGDTNISVLGLPVGKYSVEVDTGNFPSPPIQGVAITENEENQARLSGFGLITVRASKDFIKYQVVSADGKTVARGDTNISTLLLPVGKYVVEAGKKEAKLAVQEGDKKDFQLPL